MLPVQRLSGYPAAQVAGGPVGVRSPQSGVSQPRLVGGSGQVVRGLQVLAAPRPDGGNSAVAPTAGGQQARALLPAPEDSSPPSSVASRQERADASRSRPPAPQPYVRADRSPSAARSPDRHEELSRAHPRHDPVSSGPGGLHAKGASAAPTATHAAAETPGAHVEGLCTGDGLVQLQRALYAAPGGQGSGGLGPEERLQRLEDRLAQVGAWVEGGGGAAPEPPARPAPSWPGPAPAAGPVAPPSLEELARALRQELQAEAAARERACERLEARVEREAQQRCEDAAGAARRWEELDARLRQQLAETPAFEAELRAELRAAVARGQELADALVRAREGLPFAAPAAPAREGGQGAPGLQDLEARLRAQVEAATQEMRAVLQEQLQAHHEAQKLHQEAMEHEVKEREEICHMLLTYLEDKVQEERQRQDQRLQEDQRGWEERLQAGLQRCDQRLQEEQRSWEERLQAGLQRCEHELLAQRQAAQKALQDGLQEERRRCEEGLCASEQVVQAHLSSLVGGVEERGGQELLTARQGLLQSLLELRQELGDGLRVEREAREQLSARLRTLAERPAEDGRGCAALQEQQARLCELLEAQEARLGSVQNEVYRELEKTASQSREVLGALGSTRGALGACRDEVAGLRDGLEHLREQVGQRGAAGAGAAGEEAETRAAPEAEPGEGWRELRAALEAEGRVREEADDRLLAHARELVREERQGREQGHRALELGVQSVKELLFIDSGKREERDRDIQMQLAKIDEELDTVRRQTALRAR